MRKIILASQSPRRKQLLEWAEVEFIVVPGNTEENIPKGVALDEVPIHIAREKAQVVRHKVSQYEQGRTMPHIDWPVLAADTIVVLQNEIINKPVNRANAIEILSRLSGKEHHVITGVVILDGENEIAFADVTSVWFHELSPEQNQFYVDKYQPYDKAGAYAIQEWIGVVGIKKISGDFYNVMGLPISRVMQALKSIDKVISNP